MDLTTERLGGVPKRNTTLFILEYLKSQTPFRDHYVAEGCAALESSGANQPAPTGRDAIAASRSKRAAPATVDDYMLCTPLLTARNAVEPNHAAVKRDKETKGVCPSKKPMNVAPTKPPRAVQPQAGTRTSSSQKKLRTPDETEIQEDTKKPHIKKKKAPKEVIVIPSDDEHAKRLEQRRDRKRLKKAIMQPPEQSDVEKENQADSTSRDKKNARPTGDKKKAPAKGQATLAFMHGFSSTNVGKHRITVEPTLRSVGVFKKGKASVPSKIVQTGKKKAEMGNIYFSESHLLKSVGKKSKRKREPTPSSSSSSDSDIQITKKKAQPGNERVDILPDSDKSSTPSVIEEPEETARKPYDPAESIVWDIERESHIEESEVNGRQGTVVVAVPQFSGAKMALPTRDNNPTSSPVATTRISALDLDSPGDMDRTLDAADASVLSLRPSESASRIIPADMLPTKASVQRSVLMFSKFFPVAKPHGGHSSVLDMRPPSSVQDAPVPLGDSLDQLESIHLATDDPLGEVHANFPIDPGGQEESILEYPESFLWPLSPYVHASAYEESIGQYDVHFQDGVDMIQDPYGPFIDEGRFDYGVGHPYTLPPFSMDYGDTAEEAEYQAVVDLQSNDDFVDEDLFEQHFSDPPVSDDETYDVQEAYSPMYVDSLADETENLRPFDETYQEYDDDTASGLATNIDRFAQGRALLYGFQPTVGPGTSDRIPNVEAEVAGLLRQSHWMPQRL